MITVKVCMKFTHEPLKRTPVVLQLDADGRATRPVPIDRAGVARFDLNPASGKVLVSGIERYHGRLDDEIRIELWSITDASNDSSGTSGEFPAGSNAYPGMATRHLLVDGQEIVTDSEGYLVDPADWSEGFARTQAQQEGLTLNAEQVTIPRQSRGHSVCEPLKAAVGVASRPLYSRHLTVAIQRHISI